MNLSYKADPVLRNDFFVFIDEIAASRVVRLLPILYLYIVKHNK